MSLLRLVTIAYCVCVYGAHAAECLDVFPDPAASYAASGQIEFSLNSKLIAFMMCFCKRKMHIHGQPELPEPSDPI